MATFLVVDIFDHPVDMRMGIAERSIPFLPVEFGGKKTLVIDPFGRMFFDILQ
jgi:hypothetical protein